eukprot:s1290_g21.t1
MQVPHAIVWVASLILLTAVIGPVSATTSTTSSTTTTTSTSTTSSSTSTQARAVALIKYFYNKQLHIK